MRSVGVRELKAQASEIVRLVREEGQEIEITYRGRVVGKIVPVKREVDRERLAAVWAKMDRLAEEISEYWPEGVSAEEAVRDVRREL